MIDTDRMSSCKTNKHIIMTTTAPIKTVNHYVSKSSGAKYQ